MPCNKELSKNQVLAKITRELDKLSRKGFGEVEFKVKCRDEIFQFMTVTFTENFKPDLPKS